MKLLTIFIVVFLTFTTTLSAKDRYIQVTATKSKHKLKTINRKLKKMGLKMIYQTQNRRYLIYSGPYKTQKYTLYALKKIKKYFPYAKLLVSTEEKKSTKNGKGQGTFLTLALGVSSAPSTHAIEDGAVTIIEPNNEGISYNINGGYVFENNFSVGIGYIKFDANDLIFDNMYGAVSYMFGNYNNIVPYFGFLSGYSSLKWYTDPIANPSPNSNNDSTSLFWGTQTGIIYNELEFISLYLGYQCMFMEHTTNIEVDSENKSKLKHNTLHTLQIGVRF